MKVFLLLVLVAVYVQADPTPFAVQVREYTFLVSRSLRRFGLKAAEEYNDKIKTELRPVVRLKLKVSSERLQAKTQLLFDKWKQSFQENKENDRALARGLQAFTLRIARVQRQFRQRYEDEIKPLLNRQERVVMGRYWRAMSDDITTMTASFSTFFDTNIQPTILQMQAAAQAESPDAATRSLSAFANGVKQYSELMASKMQAFGLRAREEYVDKVKDQLRPAVRQRVKTLHGHMGQRVQKLAGQWVGFFKLHKDNDEALVAGLSGLDRKLAEAWRQGKRYFRERIIPVANAQEKELLRTYAGQVETYAGTMKAELTATFNTQVAPLMAQPADQTA